MEKVRGVNLGNWLVLEKWMSPQIFEGTEANDEIWLNRDLERETLEKRLHHHRETYVTAEDFAIIAAQGIQTVRIPVPYFIFGDRTPLMGCIEYLDRAFDWAEQCGMQILVDLHTVPGGQNGYDNGGLTGVCKWHRNPAEVEFVLTVLERLAQRYADRPGLWGIEVLNEPISWLVYRTAPSTGKARDKQEARGSSHVPMAFLKDFYQQAYDRIRVYLPEEKTVVFSDAFRLGRWKDWFVRQNMKNVMLDTHIYLYAMESFLPLPSMAVYRAFVNLSRRKILRAARFTPVLVGEWCVECRRPFHMARKKASTLEDVERIRKEEYQRIACMEREAWEASAGWFYWNYQMYRNKREAIVGDGQASTHGTSMDGWALNRVWDHGWWA